MNAISSSINLVRRKALTAIAIGLTLNPERLMSQVKPKPNVSKQLTSAVLLDLINKAGRQRMLSQRMAKAYAQMGLGVLPTRAFKILNDSIAMFDSQLQFLLQMAPTNDIKNNFIILEKSWLGYKALLQLAPSPQAGLQIDALSNVILTLANEAVESLDNFVGTNAGALVNLSGRQRMLTQRLAKNVLFREWLGLKEKDTALDIENDEKEYASAALNLSRDQETTERIKLELDLAQTQWLFFQAAIHASIHVKSDRNHLINVANTSERILEVFDSVTMQFQKNAQTKRTQ
jgi:Type IV pili methyl-accepting chemotaxis transducer N-term